MNEEPDREDAAVALPCWVGLLACSLALMTAHATPEPTARVGAAALRKLIARKVASNLFFLRHHPGAPPGLRQVASNLHAVWLPLAQGAEAHEAHEAHKELGSHGASQAPAAALVPTGPFIDTPAESGAAPSAGAPAWLH